MKDASTTKTAARRKGRSDTDWSQFDAMTEAERQRAALGDPDAQPLTVDDFARMKRTPRAKVIRRALGLSQEDFAARYHIPVGTLRDWEQGRSMPEQVANAYLDVIARDPEIVRRMLKLNRPAAALRPLAEYLKRHTNLFVTRGPNALAPTEASQRRQRIEELAAAIEHLAEDNQATYLRFEAILMELHNVGVHPTNALVADVALAFSGQPLMANGK